MILCLYWYSHMCFIFSLLIWWTTLLISYILLLMAMMCNSLTALLDLTCNILTVFASVFMRSIGLYFFSWNILVLFCYKGSIDPIEWVREFTFTFFFLVGWKWEEGISFLVTVLAKTWQWAHLRPFYSGMSLVVDLTYLLDNCHLNCHLWALSECIF